MIIFKEKKNLCGRSLDALAGSRCWSKSIVKPLLDFSFPTLCTDWTMWCSTYTMSLTAQQDLLRWFRKVEGWNRETCRFIGHSNRLIICIDGIIPNHVTTKADKPTTEVKRFLKAGNRYWAAQSVKLSGSEISTCVGREWRRADPKALQNRVMWSSILSWCCVLPAPIASVRHYSR